MDFQLFLVTYKIKISFHLRLLIIVPNQFWTSPKYKFDGHQTTHPT